MTDRLRDLLRDEADRLAVPPASGAAVLARGRGLRRRHRVAQGLVGLVVLAAATGGALALTNGEDDHRSHAVDPVGQDAAPADPAFSIGSSVSTDAARRPAVITGVVVTALDYTSAGVVVRHTADGASGGPQQYSLVRPDGSVQGVDVTTDPTLPDGETDATTFDTDPDEPYLAYTRSVGDVVHLVVHDVERDQQVADVVLPGASATLLQQVALDGDLAYVGEGQVVRVVDWRTAAVEVSPTLTGVLQTVAGGHAMLMDRKGSVSVVDATTGAVLVPAPPRSDDVQFSWLSPDGAHAVYSTAAQGEAAFDVYDVAAGTKVTVAGSGRARGWTPDGRLFTVSDDDVLTTCSPDTGRCTSTQLDLPVHPGDDQANALRLAGQIR